LTADGIVLLVLLAVAMALFILEWLPIDVVALLMLITLVLTGILEPAEAFSSFGQEVVMILASVFVLSGALVRTGALAWLASSLSRLAGKSESRLLVAVMLAAASSSAFLSNTNSTAVLMPATIEAGKKASVPPSRLLLPLAFASMLGGTCTLIGTSTNMASSGLFVRLGLEPLGLFEFAPVGLVLVVLGVIYFLLLGRHLLPAGDEKPLTEQYEIERYLSELVIDEESPLAGLKLGESPLAKMEITVLAVIRDDRQFVPRSNTRLAVGDLLIVKAPSESLLEAEDRPGIRLQVTTAAEIEEQGSEALRLAEVMVMPRSALQGRTLHGMHFRHRYGLSVLAIHRRGHSHPVRLDRLPLRAGDVLLVQGSEENLQAFTDHWSFWLLGEVDHVPFRKRRGWTALGALVAAVVAGGLGWVPLSVALLMAALVVVLARCISVEEVYRHIEWRLIVLIASMMSFGLALQKTGTADALASLIVDWTLPLGLPVLMGAFVVLTMALTQPLSNAAAALVVLPIAISTAGKIGVDPRSLAVLVTLAASLSFVAPLEPACLLVFGPGKYRFKDFVKVGLPLTLIVLVVLLLMVPVLWPPY